MRSVSPLGVWLWAFAGTLRLALDLRIWTPLLWVELLRVGALLALVFFHRPEIAAVGPTIVEWVGGVTFTHYPEHLYRLLELFHPMNLLITIAAGSLAEGAVTLRFARRFGSPSAMRQWKGVKQHAWSLIQLFLVMAVAQVVFSTLLRLIPEDVRHWSTKIRLVFLALEWGGLLAIRVLLAYIVAEVVIGAKSPRQAIRDGVRLARSLPLITTLLMVSTAGLMFPFFVLRDIDLADRLPVPESVVILAAVQVLVALVLTFLRLGAVTRVFVWQTEDQR